MENITDTATALNNGKWVQYNDSSAYQQHDEMPDPMTVLLLFNNYCQLIQSREAYVLLYRLRSAPAPPISSSSLIDPKVEPNIEMECDE